MRQYKVFYEKFYTPKDVIVFARNFEEAILEFYIMPGADDCTILHIAEI